MTAFNKHKTLINYLIGFIFFIGIVFAFLPAAAVADSTYDSGTYGDCYYAQSCSTAPSSNAPATTTQTGQILLNNYGSYFTTAGKQIGLQVGQIVYFNVTANGATVQYGATVKAIGSNYVVIVLGSSTIEIKLLIGQGQQLDVNNDGQKDIEITLQSITDGQAYIIFKQLGPPNVTSISSTTQKAAKQRKTEFYVSAGILAVGLLFILILLITKRRRHDH